MTGLTTRLMDKVCTHGSTVVLMKAHGKIIICMDKVHTHGVTAGNMKESTKMTKNTDSGSTSGQMAAFIGVIGQGENSTDWAFTLFPTKVKSMAFGRKVNVLSGSTRNK